MCIKSAYLLRRTSLSEYSMMVMSNFKVVQLRYTKIKHSDWLFQVPWQFLTNRSALFQSRVAMLLWNMFMTTAPGEITFEKDHAFSQSKNECLLNCLNFRFTPVSVTVCVTLTRANTSRRRYSRFSKTICDRRCPASLALFATKKSSLHASFFRATTTTKSVADEDEKYSQINFGPKLNLKKVFHLGN